MDEYNSLRDSAQTYGIVKCRAKTSSPQDLVERLSDTDRPCGTRDEEEKLEEGEHPKQCASSSDCT